MSHKFAIGDLVIFTNDFGVCWGVKEITELAEGFTETDGPRYHYKDSDTPWFPVSEKNLQLADKEDLHAHAYNADQSWFQKKYGRPTTREERESLLDTDPWEGEVYA